MSGKPGGRALVVHAVDLATEKQLCAVKAACSDPEHLGAAGAAPLGAIAQRVRAALDAAADSGGKGWCVVVSAAGRPLGALVSTRVTNYAHLSVAGLTFLAWRP